MANIHPRHGEVLSETSPGNVHRVRWTEWGDSDNPSVLFCAHGLSRNARDFDYLAKAIQKNYRVVCPDYPGRGISDWLINKSHYNNDQYIKDSLAIIDYLDFDKLDWVGTSMGGLIGMAVAARQDNAIGKLVINDVGPFIPGSALNVIGDYLGDHPDFTNRDDAINYFKQTYASFGRLNHEHYEHFVDHGVSKNHHNERLSLNHDPAIIDQFVSAIPGKFECWEIWEKISVPVLILRGAKSGLLLAQTVEQMKHIHGFADSVEFSDCAHAPSLMVPEQINVIADWLCN